jgi:hypothetical protein
MSRSHARDRSRPSGGGGAPQWTPWASLGGQWFDATIGTTGSPVSAWVARDATATATQGTVANQPAAPASNANLGNEMAMLFDGSDIVASGTAIDLSAGWTLVSVFRTDATLRSWSGISRVSIGETSGSAGTDGVVIYGDVSGVIVVGSPDATAWYYTTSAGTLLSSTSYAIVATCSGSSASIVLNRGVISGGSITWSTPTLGALAGSFAMPSATGRYLFPGGGWNSASARTVGSVALNAAVGRAVSADELASLKGYLQARFAL